MFLFFIFYSELLGCQKLVVTLTQHILDTKTLQLAVQSYPCGRVQCQNGWVRCCSIQSVFKEPNHLNF